MPRHTASTSCRVAAKAASTAGQSGSRNARAISTCVAGGGSCASGATSRSVTSSRVSRSCAVSSPSGNAPAAVRAGMATRRSGSKPLRCSSCARCTVNSRSTSPPGSSFASSGPAGGLCRAMSARIVAASAGRSRSGRAPSSTSAITPVTAARAAGDPNTGRARVSAICSHVQASSRW
ncbi:hypothetical protein WR25_19418 [Diploscapter pachys]|uniref:Uncharacterized protein n=1 Tax=Diploscapter pachys TaxID=2018661 RepID=A0A2A2M1F5_9BILA|nr:hypothetical protein WR25_19418 [Diploscapter pachys]